MNFAQIPGSLKPIAANVESALSRGDLCPCPAISMWDIQRMDVPEEVRIPVVGAWYLILLFWRTLKNSVRIFERDQSRVAIIRC